MVPLHRRSGDHRHTLSRRQLLRLGGLGALAVGSTPLLTACAGAGGGGGSDSLTFLADTRDAWAKLEAMGPQLQQELGFSFSMQHLQETPLRAKTGLELTAARTEIDVLLTDFLQVPQFAQNGSLYALDDDLATVSTFDRADFRKPFLDAVTVDGKLYGLPITQDCNILMYRADIFAELGLDVPQTMDELAAVAAEITEWGRGSGIVGFAARGQRGVGISEWTWPCFLHAFGGRYYNDAANGDLTPVLDSDEAITALDFYVKLLSTSGPSGAASYGPVEVQNDFAQGKAAMILDSATLGAEAENPEKSQVAGKLGYSVVPEGPAGRFPGFYTWVLTVPANSDSPSEAAKFIAWALAPERATEVGFSAPNQALAKTYGFPTYSGYDQAGSFLEAMQASLDMADPDYRPRNALAQEVGDIVSVAVSQAVAGQAAPADALREANRAIADVVAKAGDSVTGR